MLHLLDRFVVWFGRAWLGAWVAAYIAAAFYLGGWWGFLAVAFPGLVFLGSLRYR